MSEIMYDLNRLMKFDEFDTASVQKGMSIQQEYFNRLDNFLYKAPRYLSTYNPIVVIYGEEVQNDFLDELKSIKSEFLTLGIKLSATDLSTLEEAVYNQNEKGLSDGLVKFRAKIDIIAGLVKSTQVAGRTEAAVSMPTAERDKPVIIAVDDSLLILNIIKDMLEEEYRVIALTSGEDALLAAERNTPSLFLLDIEMPFMDGHELVKKIKAINKLKDTPVLFLTSNATRKHVFTAWEEGVSDYILKPVDKNILLKKIRNHLGFM